MEVLNTVLSEPVIVEDASSKSSHSNGLGDSGDTFSSALEEMISKLTNGLGNTGKLLIETSSTVSGFSATNQTEESQGIVIPFGIAELVMTEDDANANPVSKGDEEITVNLILSEVEGEESPKRITENQNERLDSIDNMGKSISQNTEIGNLNLDSHLHAVSADPPLAEHGNDTLSVIATPPMAGEASSEVTTFVQEPEIAFSSLRGAQATKPRPNDAVWQESQEIATPVQARDDEVVKMLKVEVVGRESTPMATAHLSDYRAGLSGGNLPMAEGVDGQETQQRNLQLIVDGIRGQEAEAVNPESKVENPKDSSTPGVERYAGQTINENVNRPSIVNFATTMGVDTSNPTLASAKDIVSQIVQHIFISVSKDKSNARIQLKPEFLGELKVKIEFSNNQLTAKFEAANSITKELIEASAFKIKQALEAHGLKIDEFVVQLKDGQHRHSGHGGFADDARDRKYGDGNSMKYSDETEVKVRNYYLDGLNEWVA